MAGSSCWTRSDKLSAMPGHVTAFGESRCQALCVTRGLDPRVHTSLQRSLTAGKLPAARRRPLTRIADAIRPLPARGSNWTGRFPASSPRTKAMRAVMLLPAYTRRYLPESITTRPVKGEVPTLDLVIAYHKSNNSPILKLLLSRVGKLAGAPC
jgi:hypothetical protein